MLAAVVVAAGCGGSDSETSAPATRPAKEAVVEVAGLETVAQRFDADRGKPRLLLILSPT